MYYSLALAEACPAQVSELWMDAAFVGREDFDSCNWERESSKQSFSARDIIGQIYFMVKERLSSTSAGPQTDFGNTAWGDALGTSSRCSELTNKSTEERTTNEGESSSVSSSPFLWLHCLKNSVPGGFIKDSSSEAVLEKAVLRASPPLRQPTTALRNKVHLDEVQPVMP